MSGQLSGKKVLVIEDEYFIASDIKRELLRSGAIVVGPVADLDAGLRLADEPLDAAVLDVNLENAMSFPIADKLRDRAVPYVFLTGYDGWSLPEIYQDAPRLAKPFASGAVTRAINEITTLKGGADL